MHALKFFYAILAMLLASLIPASVQAENVVHFGDYAVHYNALRTDTLTPEIAQAYQLTRRNNRVMVNITVQKKQADGKTTPHKAKVEGFASNLNAQVKSLEFREIQDGDAIYYIAETQISNEETLKFDIKVTPDGGTRSTQVKFNQQFFTD
ncbi:MAG: hypothetical protein QG652_1245 [Pseudomonadota bacterium]|nr:hypothetical protein [Pseudomonadota bacterium]